jgi:putative ATP-dependent endonuclease of OLD family
MTLTLPPAPIIRRLTIERFRGIKALTWYPEPGVNVILGGGDVGKTTVLDAIALLLSPSYGTAISDADYWDRHLEDGFVIEAVMSLPVHCGVNHQTKAAWPWAWNGVEPILPNIDDEKPVEDPVYRLRVRGTAEFELVYEVIQPNGEADGFSVVLRRQIGLVRLGGDDRNDRDLRLVQGSALDRLLSDATLKARLGKTLAEADVQGQLKAEASSKLNALDAAFAKQSLPSGLQLGLTGGQGMSVNALIGLTAAKGGAQLPLPSWGAGTRRLAALEIAAAHQGENPITLIDEIERGLEPYRQRILVAKTLARQSQVFLTTHSATALSAASGAAVWYMDASSAIGRVTKSVAAHLARDPEAFLARLTVAAEGQTELGFVSFLLTKALPNASLDHGIWITDCVGNISALQLLEAMSAAGLRFAGFVDDDGVYPDRWKKVMDKLKNSLFRWPAGCLEENVIRLVPQNRLEELIADPEGELTGERLRTLAMRLGLGEDKTFSAIAVQSDKLGDLIIQAATGKIPEDKKDAGKETTKPYVKHAGLWFKSEKGGRELASKVFQLGVWPQLQSQLLPFLNAIRAACDLEALTTLPS